MRPADEAAGNRDGQKLYGALARSIHELHAAIVELPSAAEKSKATAALNTLTSIQEKAHAPYAGPQGPGQAQGGSQP